MSEKLADTVAVPSIEELIPVVVEALLSNGGEAALQEIEEFVIHELGLTDAQVQRPHAAKGRRTELDYRLAWARSRLRQDGKIGSVVRGVWAIAEHLP